MIKKEQLGGGEVPVVGGEPSDPRFDTTPGVKVQHPTFLEQIFNRGEQTLLHPNKPVIICKEHQAHFNETECSGRQNVEEKQPSDKPKDTSRRSSLTQWHF